jgi:hypothetical protein
MINTVEKIYDNILNNFDTYKLTKQDGTVLWVPLDEANTDYQAIQEWSAIDGNNIIDNGGGE